MQGVAQQATDFINNQSTTLQIQRDPEYPHLIEVWEPLPTKAPNPNLAQPYCCYVNTVIFYVRPYVIRPWHHFWDCNGQRRAEKPGSMYEEWDRVESVIRCDSVIPFENGKFQCSTGRVVWKEKRWWFFRTGRRIRTESGH